MINFILELQKELTTDLSKINKEMKNRHRMHGMSFICLNSGNDD